ncbi:hypothetical protein OG373_30135 [Streptomyces avidinii]|uniref:hypothetical protein n=1 Tax=Streptomyces avidinii TaxID=1895 RepID=UPI0038699560|nr:hypothetical protein OG373_30135 [Streptomyces avidinii]
MTLGDTDLITAVRADDAARVRTLLRAAADRAAPDAPGAEALGAEALGAGGRTPLLPAVDAGPPGYWSLYDAHRHLRLRKAADTP